MVFAFTLEVHDASRVFAARHPELPDCGWHIFLDVATAIVGVVVVVWPIRCITVLAAVAAIWLVLDGISQITWSR